MRCSWLLRPCPASSSQGNWPQAVPAARYPRPAEPLTLATERLYAQGIDAFRLARRLAGRDTPGLTLDGVTGWLSLRGREVQRSLRAVDE